MADRRNASPPATGSLQVGVESCPVAADLINYALGFGSPEERGRIEGHVKDKDCGACQRWIDRAAQIGHELHPNARARGRLTPESFGLRNVNPPTTSDQTPIPYSARWQKDAFRDLEHRLKMLEDG